MKVLNIFIGLLNSIIPKMKELNPKVQVAIIFAITIVITVLAVLSLYIPEFINLIGQQNVNSE